MALSANDFLERYPEFHTTDLPLIKSRLKQAQDAIDADAWGTHHDQAVGLYAAHLIATSPLGEQAKLSTKGKSTYLNEFERLKRGAIVAPMVI